MGGCRKAIGTGAPYPPFLTATETPASVRILLRRIRREIERAAVAGYDWRAVIDALRPETQALWQALPLVERRRFLRHVRSYWDVHRHRAAPEAAASIEQFRQSEQLHVHAGRICAYQGTARRRLGHLPATPRPHPGQFAGQAASINCTGPESDYRKLQHPLIRAFARFGAHPARSFMPGAGHGCRGTAAGRARRCLHIPLYAGAAVQRAIVGDHGGSRDPGTGASARATFFAYWLNPMRNTATIIAPVEASTRSTPDQFPGSLPVLAQVGLHQFRRAGRTNRHHAR